MRAPEIIVQGMGGFRVILESHASGPARIIILDGDEQVVAQMSMTERSPEEVLQTHGGSLRAPLLIRYPGTAIHPAGDVAPVSWMNEAGRGLLRLVGPGKQLVILPLLGRLRLPHAPIASRAGRRGPSRASDLWLIVSAWAFQTGFSVPDLVDVTGLTLVTVRGWVRSMFEAGLIAQDLAGAVPGGAKRYVFVASQRPALDTFVQERWREWRSGTGHASLRPCYRYFVAHQDWRDIYRQVRQETLVCFPSGITFLEGGPRCGPRSWISPGGPVPELFLYTTTEDLPKLVERIGVSLLPQKLSPNEVPLSTLCVLSSAHPAVQLYWARQMDPAYAHGWPWGIAALDAIDHDDARVRQAAREAWGQWIENQDLEVARHRGRKS